MMIAVERLLLLFSRVSGGWKNKITRDYENWEPVIILSNGE